MLVSLEKLTQDDIYAWTKQENVPEFPTFVEDMKGGENTERKTHSVDHQMHETRSQRSTRHRTYENLDIEPEQITKVTKKKKQECQELVLPLTGLQLVGFTYVTSRNQAKMTKAVKQYCLRLLKNRER